MKLYPKPFPIVMGDHHCNNVGNEKNDWTKQKAETNRLNML